MAFLHFLTSDNSSTSLNINHFTSESLVNIIWKCTSQVSKKLVKNLAIEKYWAKSRFLWSEQSWLESWKLLFRSYEIMIGVEETKLILHFLRTPFPLFLVCLLQNIEFEIWDTTLDLLNFCLKCMNLISK